MTPDAKNDGFITPFEVFRSDVPADLVFLSVSRAGRGSTDRGESMVGLARAYFFAGAQHVLLSMWDVPDEPRRLFVTRFYELWEAGAAPAEAVRAAQEFVRSNPRYQTHVNWAGWVLWGLPD